MRGWSEGGRRAAWTAGVAVALAIGGLVATAAPAVAQFFWGWPRYYAPPPYYPPPYYPPPAYYPPPYYPPSAAPTAATPAVTAPATAPAATAPAGSPSITYTKRRAFTNAAGQPCREYTTAAQGGTPVYGTACRDAGGQWRVVN